MVYRSFLDLKSRLPNPDPDNFHLVVHSSALFDDSWYITFYNLIEGTHPFTGNQLAIGQPGKGKKKSRVVALSDMGWADWS